MRNYANLILLSFFSLSVCQAQKVIQLTDAQTEYGIDTSIRYLEDKNQQWNIEQIIQPEFHKKFQITKTPLIFYWDCPNFSTFWVQIKIQNHSTHNNWILSLENHEMSVVNFYYQNEKDDWIQLKGGTLIPYAQRVIPYRFPNFPLEGLRNKKSMVCYLELRNIYETTFYTGLSILTQQKFETKRGILEIPLGLFYGFSLLVTLLFIFFGIWQNEFIYFYLSAHVFSFWFWLFQFQGHFYYFTNKSAFWCIVNNIFGLEIYALSFIAFSLTYLEVKKNTLYLFWLIRGLQGLAVFFVLWHTFTPISSHLHNLVNVHRILIQFPSYIFIIIALWTFYKGDIYALFYLTVLFIEFIIGFMGNYLAFFNTFLIVDFANLILFCLALSYKQGKINQERKKALLDKQKAQTETIRVQKETIFLGEKVKNRTQELALANENLSKNNRQLTASNELIDLLFSELNHRVLNNLQVVSLLLRGEKRKAELNLDKVNFDKIETRINELANVHRLLMYGKNRQSIVDVAEYLRNITDVLTKLYQSDNQIVKINIDTQDLHLPLNQAYFLGFIVYELFTNSLKYAYQEVNEPEFSIQIHQINQATEMQIADNGKGLPEELWENGKLKTEMLQTLGLKIVNSITQIYQGSFMIVKPESQSGSLFVASLIFEKI